MHRIHPGKLSILFVAVVLLLILATFTTLAYLGDLNLDDLVNGYDISILLASFGTYQTNPAYNRFADLNLDDNVNVKDLAIAGRSYGSTFNFHFPRHINNENHHILLMGGCIDKSDRIHIAWSELNEVYYTRLDRYGNTLIDDLLLDFGAWDGQNGVGIGCDDEGNSHIIWNCDAASDPKTCQARIDQYGYLRFINYLDQDNDVTNGWPAVDLDSQGRAHILYQRDGSFKTYYAMVNPDGTVQAMQQIVPTSYQYQDLAVDSHDAVHLLYTVSHTTGGDDRLVYQRIGYGSTPSIGQTTLGLLGGFSNSSQRPALALDPDDNVFALYRSDSPFHLYLEKVNASGVSIIDNLDIFPDYDSDGSSQSDIAVDSHGNLHLLSQTDFNSPTSEIHTAYGTFDNNAGVLKPMRMVIYGDGHVSWARLMVDSQEDISLIYNNSDEASYPPCPDYTLCYQGTAFNTSAYNRSLPDLGIDIAHFSWDPLTIRWEQPFVITGTVFNAGWYTSTATTVYINIELAPGEYLKQEPFPLSIPIPALSPNQTYEFRQSMDLPYVPGYEALQFVRLVMEVDAKNHIVETTEENNLISSPILIQPIPTQTGLYMVIRDDTYTVLWGGDEEAGVYVNTGGATIIGPGI